MLSTVRSAASTSRTTRVIEELQDNLDKIQKELENTKTQLEIARENKETSEKDNEDYIELNKKLRQDIQEIMQVLESKQQLLDSAKTASVDTENRVKQLKDEAMAARKELDDLKKKENSFEKERRLIGLEKEKQLELKKNMEKSVAQAQAEFEKELAQLQIELSSIKENIEAIKGKDIQQEAKLMLEEKVKERESVVQKFNEIQKEMQSNNQQFIEYIQKELTDLVNQVTKDEPNLSSEVENCKGDLETLVSRIKSDAIALKD